MCKVSNLCASYGCALCPELHFRLLHCYAISESPIQIFEIVQLLAWLIPCSSIGHEDERNSYRSRFLKRLAINLVISKA